MTAPATSAAVSSRVPRTTVPRIPARKTAHGKRIETCTQTSLHPQKHPSKTVHPHISIVHWNAAFRNCTQLVYACRRGLILIDHATLHHKAHVLQRPNILQGIA